MTGLPDEAEVYTRYAARVRLFGRRHLGDAAAADDLAQQVLLIVVDALRAGRVREPAALGSFVLGTARRVASEWQRTERRRGALLARFGDEAAPAGSEGEPALDDGRLAGCLDTLAERERTVILATFYGGEDGAALARRLGLQAGHVRVIRHRAVQALSRCMGAGLEVNA